MPQNSLCNPHGKPLDMNYLYGTVAAIINLSPLPWLSRTKASGGYHNTPSNPTSEIIAKFTATNDLKVSVSNQANKPIITKAMGTQETPLDQIDFYIHVSRKEITLSNECNQFSHMEGRTCIYAVPAKFQAHYAW